MRIALAGIILAVLAPAAPAMADVPKNVTDGPHGVLEAGWVRAACATSRDGAKCVIRFPEGARKVELIHKIDGQRLGREVQYMYEDDYRSAPAPARRAASMLGGVIINCSNRGQVARCTVDYPAGTENISTTTYVSDWNYGGLRTEDLVLL